MTLSSRAASSVGPNLASSRSMRIDSVRKTSLYLWGRARTGRRDEHMHALTRCGRPLCTGGQGHQGSSEVITGHQRSSVRLYRRSRFLRHSAMLTRCSKKRLPCTHETLASHQYAIWTQSGRNQDAIKAYLQLHLDHGALLLLGELLEIHLISRGQLGRSSEGGHQREPHNDETQQGGHQREAIRGRSSEAIRGRPSEGGHQREAIRGSLTMTKRDLYSSTSTPSGRDVTISRLPEGTSS